VKTRVPARDERSHEVELDARADATFTGLVRVSVMRRNRAQAKSDRSLVLSASSARELMKQLQAAADEADRQAYLRAKAPLENLIPPDFEETLAAAVQRVADSLAAREVEDTDAPVSPGERSSAGDPR
jgi:hypothetical protein